MMNGFRPELLGGVTGVSGFTSLRPQEARVGGNHAQGADKGTGGAGSTPGVSFADLLESKLNEANTLIQQSDSASEELIAGRNKDIHGAMLSLEKADVSFRMLMGVRNKMLEAYREIMRMQV